MSLITDKVFYSALTASEEIYNETEGRIYSTAVPVPDEELDNVPLPYIVISYEGMTNDAMTKDSSFEGEEDRVTIGVMVVCGNRERLGNLTIAIREQVRSYCENYTPTYGQDDLTDLIPEDYTISASSIQYDPYKPCFYQTLSYQCDTQKDTDNGED